MACSRQSTLDTGEDRFSFSRQSSGDKLADPHALFLREVQLAPDEPVETIADAWEPWLQWSADLGRSLAEVDRR